MTDEPKLASRLALRSHQAHMTDQAKPASRPWRRFLRFSVRGLIVLVLVIGAWLGWIVRSARTQREAVAAIENAGGEVFYDREWTDGNYSPGGKAWGRNCLVILIGVDHFGNVNFVVLSGSQTVSDGELAHVGRLPALVSLAVAETNLTDAGLAHLKGLAKLSVLWLHGTRVTDAGLANLKGLSNLRWLVLDDTQITDTGLLQLSGMTKLTDYVTCTCREKESQAREWRVSAV